jgi:hypothetical protein
VTTVFLRLLDAEDKGQALRAAVGTRGPEPGRYDVDPATFVEVPRSPFAYWVSESVRRIFSDHEAFGSNGRMTRQGLATASDFRFLRGWWEPFPGALRQRWFPFAKGGSFSRLYGQLDLVLHWESGKEYGRELKAFAETTPNTTHWSRRIPCSDLYFRQGLTWPLRSQIGLSVRPMPRGCVFGQKGSAAFIAGDDAEQLLAIAAVFASQACLALVEMQMAFGAFDVGVIARTPIPRLSLSGRTGLAALAHRAWSVKRLLDSRTETSHALTLPAFLQVPDGTLAARAIAWANHIYGSEAELAAIQAEIDSRCFDLYGLDEADQRAMTEGFNTPTTLDAEREPMMKQTPKKQKTKTPTRRA